MGFRIITHDRKAHMDELLASALLSIHLKEDPLEIVRIPSRDAAVMVEKGDYSENDWFLDCGMKFSPDQRLFDHHQERELGSAALLIFETFFPHLQESELADYIRLISRVDTGGIRVLDDYDVVSESQSYWSFSQKLVLKSFEADPLKILEIFRAGLEDRIRFERAKKEAELWLQTEHHTEIFQLDGINILVYNTRPPRELASPIRAVDGKIVDENEIHGILSFDDENEENRVLFRTNRGHDLLDFTLSAPKDVKFCHQGGFLMKFKPGDNREWQEIILDSRIKQ